MGVCVYPMGCGSESVSQQQPHDAGPVEAGSVPCNAAASCEPGMSCTCPQCASGCDACNQDGTCDPASESCACGDCAWEPECPNAGNLGDACIVEPEACQGLNAEIKSLGLVEIPPFRLCKEMDGKEYCSYSCTPNDTCAKLGAWCDRFFNEWWCRAGADPGPPYGLTSWPTSECIDVQSGVQSCAIVCAKYGMECVSTEFGDTCAVQGASTNECDSPIRTIAQDLGLVLSDKARCQCK